MTHPPAAEAAFTVAVVGRPNVGKSTLFNRLTGSRTALVDDRPGVTRDRREGEVDLAGLRFRLVDTAGFEAAEEGSLGARIQRQTRQAIALADVLLFVIDGREGVTPVDEDLARQLRQSGKPVVVAVNKAEGRAAESGIGESWRLGLGEPVPLSAEHGLGLGDLRDALAPFAPPPPEAEDEFGEDGEPAEAPERLWSATKPLKLAVVGRPNAGKSTLVNRLLGEERMVTGPEAGITRDAIASHFDWQGKPVELWDTAGLRKRGKIDDTVEKMSVQDTLRAIRFAEVVVVLIDAMAPFEEQDLRIASLVAEEGRAVVLGVNKWDLAENRQSALASLREKAERLLPQLSGAALVCFSARSGEGIDRLMPAIAAAYEVWNRRVPTAALNRWLEAALERHAPKAVRGRRIRLRYMTQAKTRPPTFAVFGTQLNELDEAYKRYLINGLRQVFDLPGVPLRLLMRNAKNPYADG